MLVLQVHFPLNSYTVCYCNETKLLQVQKTVNSINSDSLLGFYSWSLYSGGPAKMTGYYTVSILTMLTWHLKIHTIMQSKCFHALK